MDILPISLNIAEGNVEANLDELRGLVGVLVSMPDLIVLPELFTTAFIPDYEVSLNLAKRNNELTPGFLKKLAAETGVAFAGSYLAYNEEDKTIRNRGFFIKPDGEMTVYDKHHVFSIGRESEVIAEGVLRPLSVEYKGWRINLAVCYDLRFPAWLRSNPDEPYDILLIPANWPVSREYAWKHLLIARAIENQAFVVGCNRAGEDRFGNYDNATFVFDYVGQPMAEGGVTLDKQALDKYRRAFPVLKDADKIIYKVS